MQDISKCQKVPIDQGAFYFGESTKEKSIGYLELKPHTSLIIHNRLNGIENLTQVEGQCVVIVFDKPEGTNNLLKKENTLSILPQGAWHIHSNPFDEISLTYWHFDGDIRKIIDEIRKRAE